VQHSLRKVATWPTAHNQPW